MIKRRGRPIKSQKRTVGRPKKSEIKTTKAFTNRKNALLLELQEINKSFKSKIPQKSTSAWVNPTLQFYTKDDLIKYSPIEKTVQVIGHMQIKTYMKLVEDNTIIMNPLNRKGGLGGCTYSEDIAKQVEKKLVPESLGVINVSMPKNKDSKQKIMILDGNSRTVGLKRLWDLGALKNKNFMIGLRLSHHDAEKQQYFGLNVQSPHKLGDCIAHPEHPLGMIGSVIKNTSGITIKDEARIKILLDIILAYNEEYFSKGKDPASMLYEARKLVHKIRKDAGYAFNYQIHEKSYKAVAEALQFYQKFIVALKKKVKFETAMEDEKQKITISTNHIIKSHGFLTVFIQDFLYGTYVKNTSIKKLVDNCTYDDNSEIDQTALSTGLLSAGLIAKKGKKRDILIGYDNTIAMLKGEKTKLLTRMSSLIEETD
jgi:hypothetical protein